MNITEAQQEVFNDLEHSARRASREKEESANAALSAAKLTDEEAGRLKEHIAGSEVTINLNVEKEIEVAGANRLLIDVLLEGRNRDRPEAYLLNTWQTGTSGGQVPPYGGGRDAFETVGCGYRKFTIPPSWQDIRDRPRYGALNLFASTTGVSSGSYGKVALTLHPNVTRAATVTFEDSVQSNNPNLQIGTLEHFDHLLADFHDRQTTMWDVWCEELLKVSRGLKSSMPTLYWEIQIHGEIDFTADVSFLRVGYADLFGTPVGEKVKSWADLHRWPLIWGYKSQVIVDPTVFPAQGVPDDSSWRWPHLWVSSEEADTARVVFGNCWLELEKQRSGLEKQRPVLSASEYRSRKRALLSSYWTDLWSTMPFPLRSEPTLRSNQETLETTLRELTLRYGGE